MNWQNFCATWTVVCVFNHNQSHCFFTFSLQKPKPPPTHCDSSQSCKMQLCMSHTSRIYERAVSLSSNALLFLQACFVPAREGPQTHHILIDLLALHDASWEGEGGMAVMWSLNIAFLLHRLLWWPNSSHYRYYYYFLAFFSAGKLQYNLSRGPPAAAIITRLHQRAAGGAPLVPGRIVFLLQNVQTHKSDVGTERERFPFVCSDTMQPMCGEGRQLCHLLQEWQEQTV